MKSAIGSVKLILFLVKVTSWIAYWYTWNFSRVSRSSTVTTTTSQCYITTHQVQILNWTLCDYWKDSDPFLVSVGHLCDLSIFFMPIQNLVRNFVILCKSRDIVLMSQEFERHRKKVTKLLGTVLGNCMFWYQSYLRDILYTGPSQGLTLLVVRNTN